MLAQPAQVFVLEGGEGHQDHHLLLYAEADLPGLLPVISLQ